MKTTEKLVCGLDETQIEGLRKKHGFLVTVTITQGENTLSAIFKEPTFEVLGSNWSHR